VPLAAGDCARVASPYPRTISAPLACRLCHRRPSDVTDQELYEAALAASQAAYAPYSNFLVGAAALLRDGRVVTGVNVENASYPIGVCAERCAISCAVVGGAKPGDFEAIGITASPCGACRQWLLEFRFDRVAFMHQGELLVRRPDELLPDSFEL
jgi:cytidine deaminase